MSDNRIKINNFFNEIFDNQILKYIGIAKETDNIPKESIIFLESAHNSIKNSINLVNSDEYVDSLCLLRSSFEAIMFSLAIYFDSKTYDVYKHYDSAFYRKKLMKKYKKMQQKDPRFKIPEIDKNKRDLLKPEIMRNIVAKNYKKVYGNLFNECNNVDEVKKELSDFYKYLCNFTHPSIVKTYTFKIQNDSENLDSIRAMFKLNINYCKILLLLALNFLTLKTDMKDIYDLYAIVFLTDLNLITDVGNIKALLEKYDEYLYLDITRKYFKNNNKKIKKIQSSIKELNEDENLNIELYTLMKEIIIKYDAEELFDKYFKA